jgi:hypothetical protein
VVRAGTGCTKRRGVELAEWVRAPPKAVVARDDSALDRALALPTPAGGSHGVAARADSDVAGRGGTALIHMPSAGHESCRLNSGPRGDGRHDVNALDTSSVEAHSPFGRNVGMGRGETERCVYCSCTGAAAAAAARVELGLSVGATTGVRARTFAPDVCGSGAKARAKLREVIGTTSGCRRCGFFPIGIVETAT